MAYAQGKLRTGWFLAAAAAIFLLALVWRLTGESRVGPVLRMPASASLQILTASDYPEQIQNAGADGRVWAIRRQSDGSHVAPELGHAMQFFADAPGLVAAAFSGTATPRLSRVMIPLLAPDGTAGSGLFAYAAPENGDSLDARGRPVRWLVPQNVLAGYSVPRPAPFKLAREPVNPAFARALARLAPARSASDYRSLVDSFAKRYGLNTNLVLAIIHSESNFVPSLVSSKSAMGLMQLLPSTASGEVHRFLYGRQGSLSYAELSVPEINIRYGTAYLHILESRYFAGVRDRSMREACVIAAYNMGPNGFLKLYGPTPELAVAAINSMGHDEFLADLQRRLPMRETRFYVEKVRKMKEHYSSLH